MRHPLLSSTTQKSHHSCVKPRMCLTPAVRTGELFDLLRDGRPWTRAQLAETTGLARSTIAARIDTAVMRESGAILFDRAAAEKDRPRPERTALAAAAARLPDGPARAEIAGRPVPLVALWPGSPILPLRAELALKTYGLC